VSWPYSDRDRSLIPPMGQGLAVIVSIVAIGLASLIAVIGYLLSLHVAAENNRDKALDAQLQAKHQEVRRLQLEYDIRSRFVELERWGATLGLGAADSAQYAGNEKQLGVIAAARREKIADAGPVAGHRGYAPEARKQMDTLIDDVLR
jgi:hypothetical protein